MKIYTKQGDSGTTAIYSSTVQRVDKDDIILDCYGTLDELNSYLGLLASLLATKQNLNAEDNKLNIAKLKWLSLIQTCQLDLFAIGFALSDIDKLKASRLDELESYIDEITAILPPQTSFILPGGCELASHCHIARTIARRAERQLVSVAKQHAVNDLALAYINRLSDFLFVLARYTNYINGTTDVKV